MPVSLDRVLKALPAVRRRKIAAETAACVRAYRSLQEIRQRCKVTQAVLARRLGISQPSVSKIEGQADMLVSTVREYIEKAGGRLDLVVTVPGTKPIALEGVGQLTKHAAGPAKRPHRPRKAARRAA